VAGRPDRFRAKTVCFRARSRSSFCGYLLRLHFFPREAPELLLQNRMRISPSRLAPAMFWTNLDHVGEFTTLQSEFFKRCIRRPLLDRAEDSHRSVSVPRQSIRRTLRPLGL